MIITRLVFFNVTFMGWQRRRRADTWVVKNEPHSQHSTRTARAGQTIYVVKFAISVQH